MGWTLPTLFLQPQPTLKANDTTAKAGPKTEQPAQTRKKRDTDGEAPADEGKGGAGEKSNKEKKEGTTTTTTPAPKQVSMSYSTEEVCGSCIQSKAPTNYWI